MRVREQVFSTVVKTLLGTTISSTTVQALLPCAVQLVVGYLPPREQIQIEFLAPCLGQTQSKLWWAFRENTKFQIG